ncbi:rhodanese-like domain-containing protein [Candidatus Dependentiae bacterium]|nr:rhodanese-like domain-containing protein [Candidatus Dependentiae bacterium]
MNNKILLINVLSKESFEDCHIPGSVNVSLNNLKRYAEKLDRNIEIIVYCASYQCSASRQAWQILDELGFEKVKAYEGGIREWYQHGLPVEGVCKAEFLNELNLRTETEDENVKKISTKELQNKLAVPTEAAPTPTVEPVTSVPKEPMPIEAQEEELLKKAEFEAQKKIKPRISKPTLRRAQGEGKPKEVKPKEEMKKEKAVQPELMKYVPLIIAFLLTLGLSTIRQFIYGYNPMLWSNDFMGSFFAVFGLLKIFNLKTFAHLFSEYDIIAQRIIIYAYLYPFIELILSALFFLQIYPLATNIFTFILMTISLIGVITGYLSGKMITCACMGGLFELPLSYITIFEDVLMATMSLVMIFIHLQK